jgi:hypothetical protein
MGEGWLGLGGTSLYYDFGDTRILNGPEPDFNIYEVNWGTPEFEKIIVYAINDDGKSTIVLNSESPVVHVPGDEAHGNPKFARSYDLGAFGTAPYILIVGTGTSDRLAGTDNGFDLDAVAAIHTVSAAQASVIAARSVLDGTENLKKT